MSGYSDRYTDPLDQAFGNEPEAVHGTPVVPRDPEMFARNVIVTADDPDLARMRMQGNPIRLSSYEDRTTRGPAPDLDEDREAILKGSAYFRY